MINKKIGRENHTFTANKLPKANPAMMRNKTKNKNEINVNTSLHYYFMKESWK